MYSKMNDEEFFFVFSFYKLFFPVVSLTPITRMSEEEGRDIFTFQNNNEREERKEQSKIGQRKLRTTTACPISRRRLIQ